ncbi:MAG: Hsp20/alpha crystallin family protein [Candidatus Paceibacterota bacterium]
MVSFLRKLRGEGIAKPEGKQTQKPDDDAGVVQLDVDVFQSKDEIVLYAPVPSSEIEMIDISIEGDNDVVTIRGKRERPVNLAYPKGEKEGEFFAKEIIWGEFFRQIILPEEVDIDKMEARLRNGILVLVLPLLKATHTDKVKVKIVSKEDE